jgi:hypothetical protein
MPTPLERHAFDELGKRPTPQPRAALDARVLALGRDALCESARGQGEAVGRGELATYVAVAASHFLCVAQGTFALMIA